MRLISLALFWLPLSVLTPAQDRMTLTVGTATAVRGQKATGAIEVPAGSDAALSIPVAVIHGAKPGPVLALVAGSHSTEYASIIALEKLIGMLNASEISGTVIIVPLINIPSFEQKVPHLNAVDKKNMNRLYWAVRGELGFDLAGHTCDIVTSVELIVRSDCGQSWLGPVRMG